MRTGKREIYYPPMGMNYVVDSVEQALEYAYDGQKKIVIQLAVQLNSFPHLGTLVNFVSGFAIGSRLRRKYNAEVEIRVDTLENIPGEDLVVDGTKYVRSLEWTIENMTSLATKYEPALEGLLKRLTQKFDLPFTTRSYRDFQSRLAVRETFVQLVKSSDFFGRLFSPRDGLLHFRIPCPQCHFMVKHPKESSHSISGDEILINSMCHEHGRFSSCVSATSQSFVDMNVPMRSICRARDLEVADRRGGKFGFLVEGGDWGVLWTHRVYNVGWRMAGGKKFPLVLTTPTIVDWAATKLSKRLYAGPNAYREYFPESVLRVDRLNREFGDGSLDRLIEEIASWVDCPKKFFRDYSVEYLLERILCAG